MLAATGTSPPGSARRTTDHFLLYQNTDTSTDQQNVTLRKVTCSATQLVCLKNESSLPHNHRSDDENSAALVSRYMLY